MNKEYYIDQSNLVLLKKENGIVYQYSFTKHFWYSLPEFQGIENTYLITMITEKEANDFIDYVNNLINKSQNKKRKDIYYD